MIGLFSRFMRAWAQAALPEPSAARRRLNAMKRGGLLSLLRLQGVPGLWAAETEALRRVAIKAYEEGRISDEDIEDEDTL